MTGGAFSGKSLHERVAYALGQRILTGELTPGSVLPPEAELSRRLGISRSVLREALKLLAAKGLVDSRPKIGTRIRARSTWNLLDPDLLDWQAQDAKNGVFLTRLLELRLLAEPAAAALAATRRRPHDLQRLTRAFERLQIAETGEERAVALIEFHQAVFDATQNDLVGALHRLAQYKSMRDDEDRPLQAIGLCRTLLQALREQDEKQAERAMRDLIMFCSLASDSGNS